MDAGPASTSARPHRPSTIEERGVAPVARRAGHPKGLDVGAVVIGNLLEWSDFAIYGYFAPVIGRAFFPAAGPAGSLNSAFAIFALGFVGRVLGGYLFARLSAQAGQRVALRTAMLVMAFATVSIGCLPTFAQAGIAAPLLLIVLRFVQGLSLGGEYTTSLTYLCTITRPERRGLMCGSVIAAATSGYLFGSALGGVLTTWLPPAAVDLFGWRIPFLLGALVAVAAYFLRGHLAGRDARPDHRSDDQAQGEAGGNLSFGLRTVAGCACHMFGFYLIFVYLPNGLQRHAGVAIGSALSLTSGALLLLAALCPLAGLAADRIGTKPMLIGSGLMLALVAEPIFRVLNDVTSGALSIFGVTILTLLLVPIQAVAPLPFIERALQSGRGTSFAVGMNVAGIGFGGLAPIAANLASANGHDLSALGWLLIATSAMSLGALVIPWKIKKA